MNKNMYPKTVKAETDPNLQIRERVRVMMDARNTPTPNPARMTEMVPTNEPEKIIIVTPEIMPTYEIKSSDDDLYINHVILACTDCVPRDITLNVRSYNPYLLGMNCWKEENGECVSPMYSGIDWRYGWNWAAACPFEFELGTMITNKLGTFICLDRGGGIRCPVEGNCLIDLLTDKKISIDNLESIIWIKQ
ncbi:hypothetical protein EHM76_01630 [bacterium]|nr:MAG: hypothetical protein EHM76_01630 [bacterium]